MKTRIVPGSAVEHLIRKATRSPERYRELIVNTAFLDERGCDLLEDVLIAGASTDMRIRYELGSSAYASASNFIRDRSILIRSLHSKVYGLVGRSAADDELLVTSANLTNGGMETNCETGVRMRASDHELRQVLYKVRDRSMRERVGRGLAPKRSRKQSKH